MKTCPYCAEDIQDAAIVCKHCGSDLHKTPIPLDLPRTGDTIDPGPTKKMGPLKILFVIGGLFLTLVLLASYFSEDHQAFKDFSARRDAWHQRCDGPRNAGWAADPDAYAACATELDALVAEGKQRGWMQ